MGNIRIPMINEVMLAGRLARDPELKTTTSGKTIANTALAVGIKDNVSFVNVKAWEKASDMLMEMRKGDPVIVRGRLDIEKWEKDGQRHEKAVVTCHQVSPLLWRDEEPQPSGYADQQRKPAQPSAPQTDDDIPF